MKQLMLAPLVACGLLLGGCSDSVFIIEGPFASDLTQPGGGGDVVLYAYDEADQRVITVVAPPLIEDARESGGTKTYQLQVGDEGVSIDLQTGSNVSAPKCNDFVDNTTVIESDYPAATGTITLVVTAQEEAKPYDQNATADATLDDVTFVIDGETVELGTLEVKSIAVGWLAG